MTTTTIRVLILQALAGAKPFPVPAKALLVQLNEAVRPALTPEQFRDHLSWLLDKSMIDFMADDLAPDDVDARMWLIREAGIAALKA